MSYSSTAKCSCPGKVLVSGGHLILSPNQSGIVLSVDVFASATVELSVKVLQTPVSEGLGSLTVIAPALGKPLTLPLTYPLVVPIPFGFSVLAALSMLRRLLPMHLPPHLTCVPLPLTPDSSPSHSASPEGLVLSSPAQPVGPMVVIDLQVTVTADEAFYVEGGKAGLGSSAAVTTSICGAVWAAVQKLQASGCPLPFCPNESNATVSILSAAFDAHSSAQGRIGSGFDIASAVIGPHVFQSQQHSPSPSFLVSRIASAGCVTVTVVSTQRQQDDSSAAVANSDTFPSLYRNEQFEPFVSPLSALSRYYSLLLLGLAGSGSDTVSLATSLKSWRSSGRGHSAFLWSQYERVNATCVEAWIALNEAAEAAALPSAEALTAASADAVLLPAEQRVTTAAEAVLGALCAVSDASNVPIVPRSYRAALSSIAQRDVVAVGVAGAGGYDSAYVVVRKKQLSDILVHMRDLPGISSITPLSIAESGISYD